MFFLISLVICDIFVVISDFFLKEIWLLCKSSVSRSFCVLKRTNQPQITCFVLLSAYTHLPSETIKKKEIHLLRLKPVKFQFSFHFFSCFVFLIRNAFSSTNTCRYGWSTTNRARGTTNSSESSYRWSKKKPSFFFRCINMHTRVYYASVERKKKNSTKILIDSLSLSFFSVTLFIPSSRWKAHGECWLFAKR